MAISWKPSPVLKLLYSKEAKEALYETVPFVFSIFVSFCLVGILAKSTHLTLAQVILFCATVFSAPLQFIVLEQKLEVGLVEVLILAFSTNARYFLYTLSIKPYFTGRVWKYYFALAFMGNSSFTLISKRTLSRGSISPEYATVPTLVLYITGVLAAYVGFSSTDYLGSEYNTLFNMILLSFLFSNIGSFLKNPDVSTVVILVLLACILMHHMVGQIYFEALLAIPLLKPLLGKSKNGK